MMSAHSILFCLMTTLIGLATATATGTEASKGSGVDDGLWLQHLYKSTKGDDWEDTSGMWYGSCNSGWNLTAGVSPCNGNISEWSRAQCNEDGRVYQLDLWFCNLRGTLPPLPTEGSMSALEHLSFNNNQIAGSLPSSFGRLKSLKKMFLHTNQISGTIPSSFSSLSNLHWMALEVNQLSGTLPSSFGSLSNLHFLYVDNNSLTGPFPSSWVSGMTAVEAIGLGYNCLDVASIPKRDVAWWKNESGSSYAMQQTGCL